MNQEQLSREIADFAFWQQTENECNRGYVRSGNSVMRRALEELEENMKTTRKCRHGATPNENCSGCDLPFDVSLYEQLLRLTSKIQDEGDAQQVEVIRNAYAKVVRLLDSAANLMEGL